MEQRSAKVRQELATTLTRIQAHGEEIARLRNDQATQANYLNNIRQTTGIEVQFSGTAGTHAHFAKHKDISEFKAAQGLGVLHGGDKGYYKEWHAKFVNVFTQVRRGSRDIL
eukprot:15274073-Alexandrium_andersonii.AAC.1